MSDENPDDGQEVDPAATPPSPPGVPPAYPGGPPPAYPGGPLPAYPGPAASPPGYPPPPPGYPPPGYPPPGYPVPGVPGAPLPGGGAVFDSPYATWGMRVGGWLIDFVLIYVVLAVIELPFRKRTTTTNAHHLHLLAGQGVAALVIQAAVVIVYGTVLIGSTRGQTVGMMAVGIRCVGGEAGERVSYGRAAGRAAFEYLLAILLVVPWIIDMLWPLWDARRQTLHDKVVGTVVLRRGATLDGGSTDYGTPGYR